MVTENTKNQSLLEDFFTEFENFMSEVGEQFYKKAEDEDEKNVIKTFSAPLSAQMRELKSYVLQRASNAPKAGKADVEQALRMSNGVEMAKNAKSLFSSIGSFLGNLGIGQIVRELKKIVDLIFDAFGWSMPKWIRVILLIIDEIIDFIAGNKSQKLRAALSQQEQNYLAELASMKRLQKVDSDENEDDDDDFS